MHVRVTTFEGHPDRIDELVAFVRDRGVGHVRSLDGNLGLTMTIDRDAGRCEVAVPFTSLDTLLASTAAVGPMRDVGDAIMTARKDPAVLQVLGAPRRGGLVGQWQGTARLASEGDAPDELLLDRVADTLLRRPDVRTVHCRTGNSGSALIVTCPHPAGVTAAVAAATPLCAAAGRPMVSTSTTEIALDADGPSHSD